MGTIFSFGWRCTDCRKMWRALLAHDLHLLLGWRTAVLTFLVCLQPQWLCCVPSTCPIYALPRRPCQQLIGTGLVMLQVGVKVPLIVRLEGTNVEEGKRILKNSDVAIIPASDLDEAATKAVASLA